MKVSVVVTAHNEEIKLHDCLLSVKKIADEIIVIDNESTDNTKKIALKFTNKIYSHENNLMLNVSKNFGFKKARNDWILSLDADERLTEELADEIESIEDTEYDAFFIPRKNIIFGRWIEHTGWYPDHQLRLFKKVKGKFEEKHVHEMIKVDGNISYLQNPLYHLNYDSINQFLNKMIKIYTDSEAKNLIDNGYQYNPIDIVRMPLSEFIKRFFAEKGYKDGMHGLVLSSLMAFYHFVIFLKIWEKHSFREDNIDKTLRDGSKIIKKEFAYWLTEMQIEKQKNWMIRKLLRLSRKINY